MPTPSTLAELLELVNKEFMFYSIVPSFIAVSSAGVESVAENPVGYDVLNVITGIVEHSTPILPGAIYQAHHFDSTLKGFLEITPVLVKLETDSDVILN